MIIRILICTVLWLGIHMPSHAVKDNMGVTHALGSAAVTYGTYKLLDHFSDDSIIVNGGSWLVSNITITHFCDREAKARKYIPFTEWYSDSQWDCLLPVMGNYLLLNKLHPNKSKWSLGIDLSNPPNFNIMYQYNF